MKKLLCFLLSMILFGVLAGCGKPAEQTVLSKDNPISISVWHYYNGTLKSSFDAMVSEFNETVGKEKGIVVDTYSYSSIGDLAQAIRKSANKAVGADKLPNLVATYVDTALELDDLGLLQAIDKYFTEEELETYISSYIEEGYINQDGGLKVFPIAKSTELLMVNKTAFEPFAAKYDITEQDLSTWEGLMETARKYYEYSGGKAFFGRDAYANYMIIGSKQLGSEIFKVDNGTVTLQLDKDVIRRLWDNFYVPFVSGYYEKSGRFATDDVKTGDIIALVGSSTGASYFPEQVFVSDSESYSCECMVLPVPNFEGTEKYAVQQGAGMAIVQSDEKYEYASAEFLKWFTEKDRSIEFSLQSAYLPVKKEANDPDAVEKLTQVNKTLKDSIVTAMRQVEDYTLYTNKAFQNGYDAREILENSMLDIAQNNKKAIAEMENAGVSHNQAVAKYTTDEVFSLWFSTLESDLRAVINK